MGPAIYDIADRGGGFPEPVDIEAGLAHPRADALRRMGELVGGLRASGRGVLRGAGTPGQRVGALARPPQLGASQGFGKRIGDGTVEAISRLTEIGVGSSLEEELERTERALAKLDEGTYGQCDACGEQIAPARLTARPDSVLCLACAGARAPRPARGPARGPRPAVSTAPTRTRCRGRRGSGLARGGQPPVRRGRRRSASVRGGRSRIA